MKVIELSPPVNKGAYNMHHETWQVGNTTPTEMRQAYNLNGDYIGTEKTAKFLCDKLGIVPELIGPGGNVCRIGFSSIKQKWYGWYHHGILGFGIGHEVEDGHLPISMAGTKARDLQDCRILAVRYAEEVG